MGRQAIGARLRFEVFKRDGFRCVYCGGTPVDSPLHVDHVVAVANGGTNDPANLVTACGSCNLGKSSVPLQRRVLRVSLATEAQHEQPRQILEYLALQREIQKAKKAAVVALAEHWEQQLDHEPVSMRARFPGLLADFDLAKLFGAIDIVAAKELSRGEDQVRYFYGVLRQWRRKAAHQAAPPPPLAPEPEALVAAVVDELDDEDLAHEADEEEPEPTELSEAELDALDDHLYRDERLTLVVARKILAAQGLDPNILQSLDRDTHEHHVRVYARDIREAPNEYAAEIRQQAREEGLL